MNNVSILNKLSDNWGGQDTFVCYGFGRSSRCEIDYLIDEFNIKYIIDNALPQKEYRGIPLVTLDEYMKLNQSYKIIILAMSRAETSIKNALRKVGMKDDEDFCDVVSFITEYNFRFRKKIVLNKMTSIVTTRCNLKCKNCVHFIPYLKTNKDISLEELKRGITLFLNKVDEVVCIELVGGETLMYPNLSEYVSWLIETYVKTGHIKLIRIISNGTILPSNRLLDLAEKYPIVYEISDYRNQVGVGKRIDEVVRLLDSHGVKHFDNKVMKWLDVGFPYDNVNMGDTDEELAKHMMVCHNHCQTLFRDKYFYCVSAGMAAEGGLLQEGEKDYLDITCATGEQILRYHLGEIPNGYLKICKYCRGFGADNPNVVRGGIQISKK